MNFQLAVLTLCQGLFLVNNVTFIAINGLVGLSRGVVRHRNRGSRHQQIHDAP